MKKTKPVPFEELPTFIGQNGVCELLDISRTTLWTLMQKNPSFPKGKRLTSRRIVWAKQAIFDWANAR